MAWVFQSDQPIYSQLVYQIKLKIASGIYGPGIQLPTVRAFAAEIGVNPNTVQRALSELERIGLIITQSTSGKFVTADREVICEVRRMLAKEQVRQYLNAMTAMGYSLADAAEFIDDYIERREDDAEV